MNKEELFKEYSNTYRNYLYGACTIYDIDEAINKITSTVHDEAQSLEEVEDIVRADLKRIKEIDKQVDKEYTKEIAEPLIGELLDLLQFEGMVKSSEYKKRAEKLKEKLSKYDGLFYIRQTALRRFFQTKIGSKYDERRKIELILYVGALDTKNL